MHGKKTEVVFTILVTYGLNKLKFAPGKLFQPSVMKHSNLQAHSSVMKKMKCCVGLRALIVGRL
jgi:hypothetical protein